MLLENQIKTGVDLRVLAPQWAIAYPIIQAIFNQRGYACVITNGNERTPEQLLKTPTTLHPSGKALDFRTKHLPAREKLPVCNEIRAALGLDWDVVLENVGREQEHIHVEMDIREASHDAADA